jgi:hypothetical protein
MVADLFSDDEIMTDQYKLEKAKNTIKDNIVSISEVTRRL